MAECEIFDYVSIQQEYETIMLNSRYGLSSLSNFHTLVKNLIIHFESFYSNTRITLENFYADQIKVDCRSSSSKSLIEFYINFEEYLVRLKELISTLEKKVLDPVALFKSQISSIYLESLNDFKSLVTQTQDNKKNIEKQKGKFYDSCKAVLEKEHEFMTSYTKQSKSSDYDIKIANDVLLKYKSIAENNCEIYKYEIQKFNQTIDENELQYKKLIGVLKSNEESRIFFLKCHVEKFSKIFEEYIIGGFNFINKINASISQIDISEDIKIFNEKYNNVLRRFPKEEFVAYESYLNNVNSKNLHRKFNSKISRSSSASMDLSNYNSSADNLNDVSEMFNDSSSNLSKSYQHQVITKFIKDIYSPSEVSVDSIGNIMDLVNKNSDFSKLFIDTILHLKKELFIKFSNYQNIQHFSNILNTISINIDNIQGSNYDLNYAIIFIAERTFFVSDSDPLRKVYLCALLARNKLYSTRTFWIDLIELKIKRRIEENMKKVPDIMAKPSSTKSKTRPSYRDISHRDSYKSSSNSNSNKSEYINYGRESAYSQYSQSPSDSTGTYNIQGYNSGMISSIGSRIKGFFNKKETSIRNVNINNMMNKSFNEPSSKAKSAEDTRKKLENQIHYQEASTVLKEFVFHFANFKLEITEAMYIVVEIASKYSFPKERISLYVTLLNSCNFTVKNKLLNEYKPSQHESISYNDSSNDNQQQYIYSISKYLNRADLLNMLVLRKSVGNNLKISLCRNILSRLDDSDLEKRLIIWESLVGIHKFTKELNYEELIKQTEENSEQNSSINDIINLDVARTFFHEDVEAKRKSISQILRVLAYVRDDVNYCQGMNYIASFIYHLYKDEKKAFYFMLALFSNTEFTQLFLNDLSRLKQLFYIFDRILTLFLPELNNYLKVSSISCSYFLSPWFITLFSNSYQFKNNVIPVIIIKIWDDFLLSGWEALIRAGVILLKSSYDELLNLQYEEMLHFLINDILKKFYYDNGNFQRFFKLNEETVFPIGLLSNIENEYVQEKKVREIDEENGCGKNY